MTNQYVERDPRDLQMRQPFIYIFDFEEEVLREVVSSMKKEGYDQAHPIVTWNGVVIDGHIRRVAAMVAGIKTVLVIEKQFANECEAVGYQFRSQKHRQNDAALLRAVEVVDRLIARESTPLFA